MAWSTKNPYFGSHKLYLPPTLGVSRADNQSCHAVVRARLHIALSHCGSSPKASLHICRNCIKAIRPTKVVKKTACLRAHHFWTCQTKLYEQLHFQYPRSMPEKQMVPDLRQEHAKLDHMQINLWFVWHMRLFSLQLTCSDQISSPMHACSPHCGMS